MLTVPTREFVVLEVVQKPSGGWRKSLYLSVLNNRNRVFGWLPVVSKLILRSLAFVLVGLLLVSNRDAFAEAPVGWRTDGTGRYPNATPPIEWSKEKNVLWGTPLPGKSHAAPLVVGERVFVTSEPTELICLRSDDGEILWQKTTDYSNLFEADKLAQITENQTKAEELRKEHRTVRKALDELQKTGKASKEELEKLEQKKKALDEQLDELNFYPPPKRGANGNTTATPVSDGEFIYVAFGTGVVTCFTVEGDRVWTAFVQAPSSNFGHSASPVLVGDKLVLHYDTLVALNAATGKKVWETEVRARFGSPIASQIGDTNIVATPGGAIIRASDGHMLSDKLFGLGHNSPIVIENTLYAFESGTNKAYRLPPSAGDSVTPELLWESSGFRQRTFASPIYYEGLLYTVTEKNIMDVLDATNGELVYRKRLDFGNGRVYPSVTLAGNYLFASSDNGTTLVFEPGREYREVARNELEGFSGAPVFIGTRMYVRGATHLYCIGK